MSTTKIKNYYALLGVSQAASEEEIKKAFRQKIIKLHPDHNDAADANKRTQELTEAYEVLKNAASRADYDKLLVNDREANEYTENRFKYAQKAAQTKAQEQSDWSVEEILASVMQDVAEFSSAIITGNTDDISFFDYLRSGAIGLLLIFALILAFTGFGTIPGIVIFWLVLSGITKGDEFMGFGRFIMSTLAMVLVLVFAVVLLVSSW